MRIPSSIENSGGKTPPLHSLLKYKNRIRIALYVTLIVYVYLEVRHFQWLVVAAANSEMSPLVQPGDSILLYRKSNGDYKPGDIIYCRAPGNDRHRFMEVIAANGGQVKIAAGKIFVNDQEKISPILPSHISRNYPELQPGQLFCVCNNQDTDARDSILEGAFAKNEFILGKVFYLPQSHKPVSP